MTINPLMRKKYFSKYFFQNYSNLKFKSEWCVNKDLKVCFITINKCAGSSLRDYLFNLNFDVIDNNLLTHEKILLYKTYKFYTIIRNPKDRYISGLNEFICQNLNNYDLLKSVEEEISNNYFIFDEHTINQSASLLIAKKYNCNINLLKMDENLNNKIKKIFNSNLDIPILNSSITKKNNQYLFCKDMYSKYCQNNNIFFSLYKNDFILYNNSI